MRLRATHGFEVKLKQQKPLFLSGNVHILINWGFNELRRPLTVPVRINKAIICINNVEYSTNKESVVEQTLLGCCLTSSRVLVKQLTDVN